VRTHDLEIVALELTVNGELVQLRVAPDRTLLELLREDLGLTGVKDACGTGDCGACTVLLDGVAVNSCLTLAAMAEGREVTTVEGLARDPLGGRLQRAFVEHGAVQCGYCTPGLLLAAKALLEDSPSPSEAEIRQGISGNLCRCTGYVKIVGAIQAVAAETGGRE
jgi:aerobic carbon-monoxide dehydrogenase small subunit